MDDIVEAEVEYLDAFVKNENLKGEVWKMYFDGASSKERSSASIVLISPTKELISMSFKMKFGTTNNGAEYEALIMGLGVAKDRKINIFLSLGILNL